jgi:very-short-patch-repair endonuclease/predicted transcriptional regulator of viral defense system
MHGFLQVRGPDELIAELADRQHGVVAHRQLRGLGIGRGTIEHRLQCGRLHRVHRGVYAVGHRILTPDGWRMAAVLAAGPGAVLSHHSAAELWGLRWMARRLHTVTVARHVRVPAIETHLARLPEDEVTTVRGIPVTTVPRTILDLAATSPEREVTRLINEADVKQLWDALSLPDLLARYPRRAGTRTVRRALADRPTGVPKNTFEDAFLDFLERHRLPRPEVNVWLTVGKHLYEADCLWRRQRVIVELDGRAAHDTARAFESDRAKDRRLRVAGWDPIRVTWRQLHREERELARDLEKLLS